VPELGNGTAAQKRRRINGKQNSSDYKVGGSDGARTRHKCNARLGEVEALSQGVSQESVPSDLKEVVKAWSALGAELRAAILAVVRSAKKGSDGGDQGQD
jgi:hypothetical protein